MTAVPNPDGARGKGSDPTTRSAADGGPTKSPAIVSNDSFAMRLLRRFIQVAQALLPGRLHERVRLTLFGSYLRGRLVAARRNDGKWVCLTPGETDRLLYGPDHKRFNKNNFFPVMKDFVRPGSVVIDVGASYGDEVIELSELAGAEGLVYAFEPNPQSFEALLETVRLNGLKNVICRHQAVGAKDSAIPLQERFLGSTSHYVEAGEDAETVACVAIDTLWREEIAPREVSFLKIDTDGFELEVLRGASAMLAGNPACGVVAEYLPSVSYNGFQGRAVLDQLDNAGFSLHRIQTGYRPIGPADFDSLVEKIDDPLHMISHDLVLLPRREGAPAAERSEQEQEAAKEVSEQGRTRPR